MLQAVVFWAVVLRDTELWAAVLQAAELRTAVLLAAVLQAAELQAAELWAAVLQAAVLPNIFRLKLSSFPWLEDDKKKKTTNFCFWGTKWPVSLGRFHTPFVFADHPSPYPGLEPLPTSC